MNSPQFNYFSCILHVHFTFLQGITIFSIVPRTWCTGQKLKHRISSEHTDPTSLLRFAQKDCAIYIHRGIQNPTGHNHWQPALGDRAGLGNWTVQYQEVTFSQNHFVNP